MKVPGFQIKRTIGRGGMATVYLAIQESLEREVVLKCMDHERDSEQDFITRFLDEGRMIASLTHPHIITVHDIGTVDNMVWIAMEHVGGGDLKDKIGREAQSVDDALELVEKVAKALGYAHERGIVHRDIKPANILFRNDGTVLLTDFGIAKQASMDRELTSTGTILGSPFYMSPEQAEGMAVDGRTDLYSLGIIFYELLTGMRPYNGDTAIKVIMQHIQSPVPKLVGELEPYQPLLNHMMAKNRDERLPDAASLLRELRLIRGDTQDSAADVAGGGSRRRFASAAQAEKWSTKKRLTTLGSCLLMVTAAMGVFYVYAKTLQNAAIVQRSAAQEVKTVPLTSVAAAPNAGVAPAPGSVSQNEVVRALEVLARKSLREDRLTQPAADNAFYYFSRLLALEPNHETAKHGFKEIADRFVVLAEKEFSRRNYTKAQIYIALGLQVDAQSKALRDLQSFIDNRERSLLGTFFSLFR